MTDNLGQSQALPYLKGLSNENCRIHIISLEKKDQFIKKKDSVRALSESADIVWHPLVYSNKLPIISPYLNYKLLKNKALELQEKENFDLVHCKSDIPSLIGYKLKRKEKVKFIFDTEGFWADERIEGKIWNKYNPIYWLLYYFFKFKEKQFIHHADGLICLTKKARKIILDKYKLNHLHKKITVKPCAVDLELFDPSKINTIDQRFLKSTLGIKNAKVFGYLGSLGTWYMLDEMLAFYSVQRTKFDNCVFLLITNTSKELVLGKAKQYNIPPKEIIVHSSDYKDVPLCLSIFDFSLIFIRPTFSKLGSSPTKQGETMAMKIPIICNSGIGDSDEIIEKYKAGKILSSLNQASFENCDLNSLEFDADKTREGATKHFSLEKGVQSYLEAYQKTL